LLQSTFTSIISSSIPKTTILDPVETILFPDPRTGIMSVISQNMEGLTTRRARMGQKSLILLPEGVGMDVKEGVAAARPDKSVDVRWYNCLSGEYEGRISLQSILRHECSISAGKVHLTLYLDTELLVALGSNRDREDSNLNNSIASKVSELLGALNPLWLSPNKAKHLLSITFIMNDPYMFSSSLSSTRALISTLGSFSPGLFSSSASPPLPPLPSRFLLFGSFNSLALANGLQGAFCTGSQYMVQKLQIMSQGVMYTAMMLPLNAAMVEESIKILIADQGGAKNLCFERENINIKF